MYFRKAFYAVERTGRTSENGMRSAYRPRGINGSITIDKICTSTNIILCRDFGAFSILNASDSNFAAQNWNKMQIKVEPLKEDRFQITKS